MLNVTQEIKDSGDALEAILGKDTPYKVWRVKGLDGQDIPRSFDYVQSELSFFEKQDFIVMFGGLFDRLSSGEFGIGLKELFSDEMRNTITTSANVTAEDAEKIVEENTSMIQAVIKVINEIPGLQLDLVILALGVPTGQKDFVREILAGPVARGGLTDDQGFEILTTFITQNAGPIRTFFDQRGRDLVDHFRREVLLQDGETLEGTATEAQPSADTPGGTPSSTTQAPPDSILSPSETGQPPASS